MKHIKLFETASAFETARATLNLPNVSLIKATYELNYLPYVAPVTPVVNHDYANDYLTFVAINNCEFGFNTGYYTDEGDGISYSLDNGNTWSDYMISTHDSDNDEENFISVSAGNKVLFKGRNFDIYGNSSCELLPTFYSSYSKTYEGNESIFNVEGNIMSLLYGDNFINQTEIHTTHEECAFACLFYRAEGLTNAENLILPATTLEPACYMNMFMGCTSLTTAPLLPATTLAYQCYNGMFYGCSSLTTAPLLPATTLAECCYEGMFGSCSSLNSITCLATNISTDADTYDWLDGVAQTGTFKLATASIWENGASGIPDGWNVEYYDISQISSYAANYFTLVAIDNCEFEYNCVYGQLSYSLDNGVTWSELYQSRKEDNKISVTAGNKILFKGNTNGSFTGTCGMLPLFHSNGRYNVEGNIMSLIYEDDFARHMSLDGREIFTDLFVNETNLISAANLILPEILLGTYCYRNMFGGCTNLTSAPVLPAKILTNHCYDAMFYNCTSLNSITCLATNISAEACTVNWVNGVAQTGTFIKSSDMTDWETGNDGIPSGWTVQNI